MAALGPTVRTRPGAMARAALAFSVFSSDQWTPESVEISAPVVPRATQTSGCSAPRAVTLER
jgi:hypothetical protein